MMRPTQFPYGGQAVPEGVMMRGLRQATVAVRLPDGSIAFADRPLDAARRVWWAKVPVLRGIQMLGDALMIGVWALQWAISAAEAATARRPDPLSQQQLRLMASISVSMMLGLFFVAPLLAAAVVQAALGWSVGMRELLDSLLRLLVFVGYLVLLRRSASMRRVFGYHGAEHKTVNAYEAGAPLTVADVRPFTLIHPRCGTSFVLVLLLISVVIFAPLGPLPLGLRLLSRLALVPVIAGVGYELLRLSARHYARPWVRALIAPALALQQLTTEPPDDTMLEVALVALSRVLAADGIKVETAAVPGHAVQAGA